MLRNHGGEAYVDRVVPNIWWIKGVVYTLLFVVGGVIAVHMFATAWERPGMESWGIIRILTRGTLNILGIPPAIFFYIPTGFVGGLLLAMVVDDYKRGQTLMLLLGIGLAVGFVLLPLDVLVTPLLDNYTHIGGVLGVVAVLIGLRAGGVSVDIFDVENRENPVVQETSVFDDDKRPFNFQRAPKLLYGLAVVACLWGLVDAHVAYDPPIAVTATGLAIDAWSLSASDLQLNSLVPVHAAGSVLLLLGLDGFRTYEQQNRTLLLGPARSGKTAALGGLHAALTDMDESNISHEADGTLKNQYIMNGRFPPVTEAGDYNYYQIQYDDWEKWLFKREVSLETVDYPGEHLASIVAPFDESSGIDPYGLYTSDDSNELNISSNTPTSTIDSDEYNQCESWSEARKEIIDNINQNNSETGIIDDIIPLVSDLVYYADTIVLVVPLDDFVGTVYSRDTDHVAEYQDVYYDSEVRQSGDTIVVDGTELDRSNFKIQNINGRDVWVRRRDRESPEKYVQWYKSLINAKPDTDFIMTATMADLVKPGFESVNDGEPPEDSDGYAPFADHLLNEVLTEQEPLVTDIVESTEIKGVFPLWYTIENDKPPRGEKELRIDTQATRHILMGSKKLLTRINLK